VACQQRVTVTDRPRGGGLCGDPQGRAARQRQRGTWRGILPRSWQADICEPLLAIADHAGGSWSQRCREALVGLYAIDDEDEESLRVKLLADIRKAFESAKADRLGTEQLLGLLVARESDAPWADWWEHDLSNGNTRGPAAKLARLLRPFRIRARGIRLPDGSTPRGYLRQDFEEAWKRYCPPKSD
jgi:uncharacterized protein DUF3631